MVMKTTSFTGEIKEADSNMEGYEFVVDEEGRKAIKKIRNKSEKVVETPVEKTEDKPVKKKSRR